MQLLAPSLLVTQLLKSLKLRMAADAVHHRVHLGWREGPTSVVTLSSAMAHSATRIQRNARDRASTTPPAITATDGY